MIARALHGQEASLIISGRRIEALETLRSDLGDRAEVVPADLAKQGDLDRLVERAGAIDVLVAAAALPASGRIETFAAREIDRALEVNLHAPIQLARAFTPGMVACGSGHLVFISSLAGKIASGGGSLYSATKFGMRGFALALRDELRGTGVGVTTVFPGFIREAGMWADTGLSLPRGVSLGSPEQVAAAVIAGIEQDRAELDVAPLPLRIAAWVSAIAPTVTAAAGRRLGSRDVAEAVAKAQRAKR